MRYYQYQGARIYGLDPFSFVPLSETLKDKACRFVKKHCIRTQHSTHDLIVHKPFWGEPICLSSFYFYEKNSVYYEFFTGVEIAKGSSKTETYLGKEIEFIAGEFLCDFWCTDTDTNSVLQAYPVTESQFAHDIEPFMKYREAAAAIIGECLEIRHEMWLFLRNQEEKKLTQQQSRDNFNSSFLRDFLNNRL